MATTADHLASVPAWSKTPDEDKEPLARVVADVESFEKGIGQDFRERCNHFYRQYRGFRRLRDDWTKAGPNDRDGVLYDAKKHWGAHLHIPMSFATIERMVPRAIANRPRMLYLPRDERWELNVQNVRLLIDSQQEQIDIDLPFQAVMRSGMIYGLGVGKSFWRREYANRRRMKRRTLRLPGRSEYVLGRMENACVFDDPDFEDVDVFDFGWDQYGSNIRTCGHVWHRTWLSLDMCLDRVASGAWNTASAQLLTEDDIRRLGGSMQKYDDVWQERMTASGFGSFHFSTRGEQIHEVIEWHDGQQVFTVLDRQVLVQAAENPCVWHIPFQVYRPTPLQKQMVGIGELEPIEHLQRELDTLRSQRRDAATLALCAGYAYDDGAIDEEDLVFGPAAAIRVTNARPVDAIMPLPTREPGGTSYQEEQVIRSDFDVVGGLSEQADQQGAPASTATEAQLVQAALSSRIELKSRRFEIEVVRHAARCFLYLDQRMIMENRSPIRQPQDGYDMQAAAREGRWQWFPIGPGELQGEYEIIAEGGSMAAQNVPQMRQDAGLLGNLEGNPHVDQRKLLLKRLELLGIKNPESWLTQQDQPVPPAVFDVLGKLGVDPRLIQTAIQTAQAQDPQLPDSGPDQAQVSQALGVAA